ncbi:hypothetical protein [Amycolatopsis anabasis]|uniref:hypothetical protein n=1 Tax=Amycolatopsis anabasis TaxID=1840409 RepID=UPI00131BE204|nr:hypothetical protein [Amycolatopsis anabasis]
MSSFTTIRRGVIATAVAAVLMLSTSGIATAAPTSATPANPATVLSQDDSARIALAWEYYLTHAQTEQAHAAYKLSKDHVCKFLKKHFGVLAKFACDTIYKAAAVLANPPESNECLRASSHGSPPGFKFQYRTCKS